MSLMCITHTTMSVCISYVRGATKEFHEDIQRQLFQIFYRQANNFKKNHQIINKFENFDKLYLHYSFDFTLIDHELLITMVPDVLWLCSKPGSGKPMVPFWLAITYFESHVMPGSVLLKVGSWSVWSPWYLIRNQMSFSPSYGINWPTVFRLIKILHTTRNSFLCFNFEFKFWLYPIQWMQE